MCLMGCERDDATPAYETVAAPTGARLPAGGPVDVTRDRLLAKILTDLDRCEHGRHQADSCLDCPGGRSRGNWNLPPGEVVGYDRGGVPYVMPRVDRGESTAEPGSWRPHRAGEVDDVDELAVVDMAVLERYERVVLSDPPLVGFLCRRCPASGGGALVGILANDGDGSSMQGRMSLAELVEDAVRHDREHRS